MTLAFIIAIAIILGLVLLLIREIRSPPGSSAGRISPEWQKRIRIGSVVILLGLGGLGFLVFLIESKQLIVRQESIRIVNWSAQHAGMPNTVDSDIDNCAHFINGQKLLIIPAETNTSN